MTREEAARAGRTTYPGRPCKHGHDGERYVSDGKCVHCGRERSRGRAAYFRELRQRASE